MSIQLNSFTATAATVGGYVPSVRATRQNSYGTTWRFEFLKGGQQFAVPPAAVDLTTGDPEMAAEQLAAAYGEYLTVCREAHSKFSQHISRTRERARR